MNAIRVVVVLALAAIFAGFVVSANPPNEWATVRLPDQGGSGVAIWTSKEKTYLLTAGHCFNENPIRIQFGVQSAKRVSATKRWVAVNKQRDLALIELSTGPVPSVAPIALLFSEKEAYSWGHDGMCWPKVGYKVKIKSSDARTTWTYDPPKEGRSGGPLLNSKGELIGICQGYVISRPHDGVYASLQNIHEFLKECNHAWLIKGEGPKGAMPLEKPSPNLLLKPL